MSYNPDYKPTGPNNRSNEYYKKINHVRIARNMASRSEFYGSSISVAPGGVAPSAFAYTEGMRLDAHPDYLALTSTTNWQTDAEGKIIVQAFFLVDGSAQADDYLVVVGETVTLFVADDNTPVASIYEYTIDASVNAFILQQPQPVDILEGDTATFSVFAPTATSYHWEYTKDGVVWQQGSTSNLQASYPNWVGTSSDDGTATNWQITDAHADMNGLSVVCYMNGIQFVTNMASLSVTDVMEQPAVLTPAFAAGDPVVGQTLTGTPATFSGGMVTVANLWEVSTSGAGNWTSTGNTTTTSPALALGRFYRFKSTGTNGAGSAVSISTVIGPVIELTEISVEDGNDPAVLVPSGSTDPYVHTIDGVDYSVRKPDDATLTVAMIEASPTYITNPAIAEATIIGVPRSGAIMNLIPALILYAGDDPGDATFQVYIDGVPQPGETETTYTVKAEDDGKVLKWVQEYVGVFIDSNEVLLEFGATEPAAFVDENWSVVTSSAPSGLDITVASLPADNGSVITDVEYDVDEGAAWTSLALAAPGTVTVTMPAGATPYDIRLRARNMIGAGLPGNIESATSGVAAPTFHPVDLFTGPNAGTEGFFVEPQDTTSMWADTGRTQNVSADNTPILRVDDRSTNTWLWDAGGATPVYRNTGGYQFIQVADTGVFRNSNKRWNSVASPGLFLSTFMVVRAPTQSGDRFLYHNAGNQYVGLFQNGNNGPINNHPALSVGSITFETSSGVVTTANGLYDAMVIGDWMWIAAEGHNAPGPGAWHTTLFSTDTGSFTCIGDYLFTMTLEKSVADANRANIIAYMEGLI